MSLVRLLTTGKSLVGISDTTSRYRLARQNLLPKFGSEKNPFTSTVVSDNAASQSAVTEKTDATAIKLPHPRTAESLVQPRSAQPMKRVGPAAGSLGLAKMAGEWLAVLNPFSLKAGSKLRPGSGARSAVPVQGELSLDKVKVVRNDLSNADLEVVPLRSATGKTSAGVDVVIAAGALAGTNALDGPARNVPRPEPAQIR